MAIVAEKFALNEAPSDLAKLLQDQQKKPMNLVWIAYYWEQVCSVLSSLKPRELTVC
jgi:hypothetical protein